MLQLLKSSFWSLLSVLVRAVSSLSVNKLLALYYGPDGITLYAHFQNLLGIITTVPNGGVNIGAITLLAAHQPNSQVYQRYFLAAFLLNLLCFSVALALVFLFPGYYLEAFVSQLALVEWALVFAGGSLLLTLNQYLLSVLLARRELKWYVLGVSAMSLGGLAVVYAVSGSWGLSELFLLMFLAQPLTLLLVLPALFLKKLLPRFRETAIPTSVYRDLWKYILMALSAVACLKLTDFYIRDFVIARYSLYQTGLWQAVVRVSEQYSGVYTAVVGMVVYPRMAALLGEAELLRRYVRNAFYLLLPILAAALLLVYLFRDWVLLLLFDEVFVQAAYLFPYQLLGDFCWMASMLLTNLLVVRAQVKLYIGWQVCSALLYIALVFLLIGPFGLAGVTLAHAIRYAAVLGFFMLFYRQYLRL